MTFKRNFHNYPWPSTAFRGPPRRSTAFHGLPSAPIRYAHEGVNFLALHNTSADFASYHLHYADWVPGATPEIDAVLAAAGVRDGVVVPVRP